MRVLVLSPRFPEAGGKGDQLRAFQQISQLAERHQITVLSTTEPRSPEVRTTLQSLAQVVERPSTQARRAAAALTGAPAGVPGQVGYMMPVAAWTAAEALARDADVVLASTVRAVRGPLDAPVVLDHIDCLSLNMAVRARGPESVPVRLAARAEALLLRRWERRAAGWSAAQVVTAREDAAALPSSPPVHVLPQGWDGDPFDEPPGHVRDLDVVFTGNMSYPPNRDAAQWIAAEIAPLLRERRPDARILVVGRNADRLRLDGLEVASDVPDLHAYLRRARVALVPLRGGTGAPNKVVEAAASGAALVATPWTLERFAMQAPAAQTAGEFAAEADRLLGDEDARRAAVEGAMPAVREHTLTALIARLEELLQSVARS
jgi:glycosyltransferase involved in cell wall biosynthesis